MSETWGESKSKICGEERERPEAWSPLRGGQVYSVKGKIVGREVSACSPWSLRRKELLEIISNNIREVPETNSSVKYNM